MGVMLQKTVALIQTMDAPAKRNARANNLPSVRAALECVVQNASRRSHSRLLAITAPPKSRKRATKTTTQASNDENSPAPADMPSANNSNVDGAEVTASGRRVRKDKGKERTKARPWDEGEEAKFIEALHLHGRDWKKCAEHVGSRDARAITSHAQKYFIKLCLQGKKLPRKVAESGDGYTLSGKPLDPNSAAARAYGFKPDSLQRTWEHPRGGGFFAEGVVAMMCCS